MLMTRTIPINDPNTIDRELVSLLNEPGLHLDSTLQPKGAENQTRFETQNFHDAKLVSGPTFWTGHDGRAYVTAVFEVTPTADPTVFVI